MANATADLKEAEQLIRKVVFSNAISKTLEICRWLLSFNALEKHKIKCYQSFGKLPDIRFCIDRGHDCIGNKIMTNFLVIEPNYAIMGLYSRNPEKYRYFKPDQKRWNINSTDTSSLPIATIREHIFESYELKLSQLGLVSNVSSTIKAPPKSQPDNNGYEPTKEDFESAYCALTRPGETISIDSVLDQMEINAMKKGLSLKSNWRMVTEKNIEIWSKKS